MTTPEQIRARAEAAQAAFGREEAKLYRPDGEKRYSDTEHRERMRELQAERRRACREALADAEGEYAGIRREIEGLNNRDLSGLLTPEEASAAASRKAFVEDEASSMDSEALAARLRSVASGGDRPGMFCHLQAAKKRAAEHKKGGGTAIDLQEHIREVEAALFGGSAGKELKNAEERLQRMSEAATLADRLQRGARTAAESWEARTFRPAG